VYRFDWSIFATPELVREICSAAGVAAAEDARIRPVLASILERVGGPAIAERQLAADERTRVGRRLLDEAIAHAAAEAHRSPATADAYLVGASRHAALALEARAAAVVEVNAASAEELAALPALGIALGRRIVAAREHGGRFTSLEDLDARVDGVGPKTVSLLSTVLRFDGPLAPAPRSPAVEGPGEALVRLLPEDHGADRAATLERVLRGVLVSVATTLHPAIGETAFRDLAPPAPDPGPLGAEHTLDWCGVLWGGDYWKHLPALLRTARRSIDVCLFHMALGAEGHPTRTLVAELVAAKERGVKVRVLLDRDRPSDPYHSTIINSAASMFLTKAGVSCRHDSGEQLLHSKFLLVDGDTAVVGSHNWTEGSYFEMDDLSLVMHGAAFGQELAQRFESLWQKATVEPPPVG
jgi:DNA uptake protein ComE-like DNA-binding protein